MFENERIKVLLVEDQALHAQLMIELFNLRGFEDFELVHSQTLEKAMNRLAIDGIDIVLLDLNLPDSKGYHTFEQIWEHRPDVPVILLTADSNEEIALKAIQNGAQDFLVKGDVDSKSLKRAVRYALERHQMQSALRSLSLTDELTGLYNRRGFSTLADQHLKLARRTGQEFFIIFADLDDLKKINDSYGHAAGDAALRVTAETLRKTFTDSDIIARYGGDEFLVILTDAVNETTDGIYKRLSMAIDEVNKSGILLDEISLSLGIVPIDPHKWNDLDKLIAAADKALYADKQLGV